MRRHHTPIFRPRPSEERGVALILTLAIIALVTLLMIAFVTSMRVENAASKSFNDLIKAREIAQGAVDQAVATIRQATPERTANGAISFSTYVTFPGVIWDNNNGVVTPTYLFSAPTSSDTINLNAGFFITGQNPVEFPNEANSQINVGWLYVAEDGTVGPSPLVGHGAIVGRFAFWADDEAAKINLNTAGVPTIPVPPDYGTSVSNDVDLSVLLPGLDTLTLAITARQASPTFTPATPGYTTIEEVKLADPTVNADSDFAANRFYLTTYSNDANYPLYQDDLNSLNLPRLVLANIHDFPGDSDILGTAGAGISNAFTYLSTPALATMLSASATPNAFSDKYTPNGLRQVIANIIAYQLDPTSPTFNSPAHKMPDDGNSPPTYLGLAKTPYINEVQVNYDITIVPPVTNVTRTVSVELFYMYDDTYTTGNEQIRLNNLPTNPAVAFSANMSITILPGVIFPNQAYKVFTASDTAILTNPVAVGVQPTPTRVEYFRKNGLSPFARLDYSEMLLTAVNLDPAANPAWHGAQAADPCVNDTDGTWQKYSSVITPTFLGTLGSGGIGLPNVWQATGVPPGNPPPPQNNPSLPMSAAYPFGYDFTKAVIRTNAMVSLGELGYIHTPFPGQYIRLQPQPASEKALGQIPDWAMLDLFTVAAPPTAGRININSFINPGFPNANVRRLVPLKALLNSASGMIAPTTVPVLAQQIYDDITRSVGIDTYGMRNGRDGIFDTIGEICEAPGVADNAGKLEADREAAVRRIANLITVRSSTFTIWVMAQSIKQPPGSTLGTFNAALDQITGEVKAQAVVERYESTPGVAGSVPKFRTRYFRYLYN